MVANHLDIVVEKERAKQSRLLDARLQARYVVNAMLAAMFYAGIDAKNRDHITRMWHFFFSDQSVVAYSKNPARQAEIEKEAEQFREAGEKMNTMLEEDPLGSGLSMRATSHLDTKNKVLKERSKLLSLVKAELKKRKLL